MQRSVLYFHSHMRQLTEGLLHFLPYTHRSTWLWAGCASLLVTTFATGSLGRVLAQAPRSGAVQQNTPTGPSAISTKTLPNGLQVIVYEDHSVPLVTVEYGNKAGSAVEPPEKHGLSHLIEHLFFMTNRAIIDHEPYLKDLAKASGIQSGATREEGCSAYVTVATRHMALGMRYLRDATRYPAFLPEEVASAKSIVLGELERSRSNIGSQANLEINNRLYYKYTSRKIPGGNPDAVEHATPEQIQAFWAQYWVPDNSVVVVSGDVTPEAAFSQVEQLFGDWKTTPRSSAQEPQSPEHPPLVQSSATVLTGGVTSVLIQIAWQGPSALKDSTATYAADVFSEIVNQPGSHFSRALIDSGLAGGVTLGHYTQRNVGIIKATIQTTPENARATIKAVNTEIAHFTDADYLTAREIENAKHTLAAQDLYEREKPTDYAHTLNFWWASTGIDYYKNYQRSLSAVAMADIQRFLNNYVASKPRVVVVVLPLQAQQTLHLTTDEMVGR